MRGSPPGMLTIGAPHSSTAARHCATLRCFLNICPGYWIFPQPAQARLQRNSGSSMRTRGYCFRPASFWRRTYVATVHICETGMPMVALRLQRRIYRGDAEDAPEEGAYQLAGVGPRT